MGKNFALQYNGFIAGSKETTVLALAASGHGRLNAHEFNVLYQIHKTDSFSVGGFTGFTTNKWSVTDNISGKFSTSSKTKFQLGILGTVNLSSKTTAYSSLGFGSKLANGK